MVQIRLKFIRYRIIKVDIQIKELPKKPLTKLYLFIYRQSKIEQKKRTVTQIIFSKLTIDLNLSYLTFAFYFLLVVEALLVADHNLHH